MEVRDFILLIATCIQLGLAYLLVFHHGLRHAASRALGLYLISFSANGLLILGLSLDPSPQGREAWRATWGYLAFGDGLMLIALAAVFPRSHPKLPAFLHKTSTYVLVWIALAIAYFFDPGSRLGPGWGALKILDYALNAAGALTPVLLFHHALRSPDAPTARPAFLIALGVSLDYAFFSSFAAVRSFTGTGAIELALSLPGMVFLASSLALLARGALAPPHAQRTACRAALAVLVPLVVLVLSLRALEATAGLFQFTRLPGPLVMTYGILRGQLLDIDSRVRWSISRSTVAAVFIAVFFVASEAAQQFFGDHLESGYLGILAAGALVFAIAPLTRVADRFAERALPIATPPGAASAAGTSDAERDYRAAVRVALADRDLTKDEERALLRLAERVGIPASRALAIHEEMEREVPR